MHLTSFISLQVTGNGTEKDTQKIGNSGEDVMKNLITEALKFSHI